MGPIVLWNSDAIVCCLSLFPWGVSSWGAAIVRVDFFSIRNVLLWFSKHTTGGLMLSGGVPICSDRGIDFDCWIFPFPPWLSRFGLGGRCWNEDRFCIGIAVFRRQWFMMKFGMCRFTWQFAIVVRDMIYLARSRGAVCDTAVIDNGLRILGAYIVWGGIVHTFHDPAN